MSQPRRCGVCDAEADTWVLVCCMWPETLRRGETVGMHLCPVHLEEFRVALVPYRLATC